MIDRRQWLLGAGAAALIAAAPGLARRPAADPWDEARAIVRGIERPRLGRRRMRLYPPENGDIRASIHAAIERLGAGGGTIILPPGDWLSTGPIHLKSRIRLHLPKATRLRFSRDPEHYLPLVFTRWEGTECWNYSPLIYARDVIDIAITGAGTIDGQGFAGFFRWRAQQQESQQALRRMGAEGVPVSERRFGPGHFLRPAFIQFVGCRRVLIEGVSLVDSPFWMVHPVYCDHVTVRGVRFKSDHLNSDGCDPDSSTNVLIERCIFDCGDDGVAIKAGRDQDGWRVARPAARIVVRACDYRGTAGGGLAIGSEMSGGVSAVFVERYTMGAVANGIYLKSNRDRGGAITDVFIRDVTIARAEAAISLTTDYHGYRGGDFPTRFDTITIEDVTCGEAVVGLSLVGAAGAPLGRIALRNVAIGTAKVPLRSRHAPALAFERVRIGRAMIAPQANTGPETFSDRLKL